MARIEQRGLYADELTEGDVYVHRPGRTLTEADNVFFTTLTMNTQALHLDEVEASRQPYGRRLMNSMLTLSTMVGQSVGPLTQGTLVAQLGLGDIRFPAPVFAGDTVRTETLVEQIRESASRPGQAVVTLAHTGYNQDGTVVGEARRTCLMWTRAAHESHLQDQDTTTTERA